MTAQEQWQAWRSNEGSVVGIEEYISWVRDVTCAESDSEHVFDGWRVWPERESVLRRVLGGEIAGVGSRSQVLLGMFFALYQVANGRKCFLVASQQMPISYLLLLNRSLSRLGKLTIRCMGAMLLSGRVYLGDCQNVDVAVVDYCELLGALRRNPEQFKRQVQSMFFLEVDSALYDTRIIVLERGVERAAGMIYKNPSALPEDWADNPNQIDVPMELGKLSGIVVGGCYSYTDRHAVSELLGMTRGWLKPYKAVSCPGGYAAFAYGTNQSRVSALVQDVMRTDGHALIVCCTPAVFELLCSELRKSGQSYTASTSTLDTVTFFSQTSGEGNGRKVLLFRGSPSPLVLPSQRLCRGTLYLAESFLSPEMHEKSLALAEGLFEQVERPRLYFSLSDELFVMYDSEGGFRRMFSLIEFTEKYDPWRQIRRVLAKCMLRKLHSLRISNADNLHPVLTMVMDGKRERQRVVEQAKPSRLSKLDAPCFCGSGKPFRECHGKQAVH